MTPLKAFQLFVSFFFTLFSIQTISKAFYAKYTNEQIGAWLRTDVPYTGALIGALIFSVVMYFVAKRNEQKAIKE